MTAGVAFETVRILITLAVLHQSVEALVLRRANVFDWAIVREDFERWPKLARTTLDALASRPQMLATAVALVASFSLVVPSASASLLPFLLVGSTVASLRERGAVGGGSDSMTFQVLGALWLGAIANAPHVALCAIAVQGSLSYFLAGVAKIREARWRCGTALRSFTRQLGSPGHRNVFERPAIAFAASWAVILFECGFPLALVSPPAAALLLFAGAAFHLANAHLLGLHRFILPWLATYPAVAYIVS